MRSRRIVLVPVAVSVACALGLASADAASATAISVTTSTDEVANDGHCSLREAISAANSDTASGAASGECPAGSGTDSITLPSGTYTLAIPGAAEDANKTGDLDITSDLTIAGAGASRTTIDAAHLDRVLSVTAAATVAIEGVTITGGRTPPGATGPEGTDALNGGPNTSLGLNGLDGGSGGGILNAGTLTVTGSAVIGNATGAGGNGGSAAHGGNGASGGGQGGDSDGGHGGYGGDGGGLYNTGTLTIVASEVSANSTGAGGNGGPGGHGGDGGSNASADGGLAGGSRGGNGGPGGRGGGIFSTGSLAISNSSVSGNVTGDGGDGGPGGTGGRGGEGGGSGSGGDGGGSGGGGGGPGGVQSDSGAGVLAYGGPATLTASTVNNNSAGAGGRGGGGGQGGDGGNGGPNGGNGGAGGGSAGAIGGGGGGAGGGEFGGLGPQATGTISSSTIAHNTAGTGGDGGTPGTSGAGGQAGTGGAAGRGGNSFGGIGGPGGRAGGLLGPQTMVTNSTITANRAGAGGDGADGGGGPNVSQGGAAGAGGDGGGAYGISPAVTLDLLHDTIDGNSAGAAGVPGTAGSGADPRPGSAAAGGIGGGVYGGASFENTIVANNALENCAGFSNEDRGNNLSYPEDCAGQLFRIADPKLGPLQDNGGPTPTQAIGTNSGALDQVSPSRDCTSTDQRGMTRPQRTACDIGAFELGIPVVTISVPTDGTRYGRGVSIPASFACTEGGSSSFIASCVGTVPNGQPIDTSTLGARSFTVTATGKDGEQTSRTVRYTVEAPLATISSPADGRRYGRHSKIHASFRCVEVGSTTPIASCVGTVPNGDLIDTSTFGVKSFTVLATDQEGNQTSKTVHYRVEAPIVTINSPVDGHRYRRHSKVHARFRCTEAGSTTRIASCMGTVPNGHLIDTSSLGVKSFAVTAIDADGNRISRTIHYRVKRRSKT